MLEARKYNTAVYNGQPAFKVKNANYRRQEERQGKKNTKHKKVRISVNMDKFTLVFVYLLFFLLAVSVVAQYCAVVTTNFQMNQAQVTMNELLEEQRVLELELARLASLDRIENIARTELGMKEVRETIILTSVVGD